MEEHLSEYSRVLDLEVTMYNGCFMGQGYVTLDLSVDELRVDPPLSPLQGKICWHDNDDDVRQSQLPSLSTMSATADLSMSISSSRGGEVVTTNWPRGIFVSVV